MIRNNARYDLSDRLIHFFRPLDMDKPDAPLWPEQTSCACVIEDPSLRPYFLIRHAIRLGRLYATWSLRSGRRTIHGHRPAVCFTDMPIPAFIQAARSRAAAGEAISPYGIVFPKAKTFSVGARPVIYGLSTTAQASGGTAGTPRLFDKDVLPLAEQYRYVAYDPANGRLDWSHEREWRWPLDDEPWSDSDGCPPETSEELPGLNIDDPKLSGLGIILPKKVEANGIIYDILTKIDRGDIDQGHYQFVLAHEAIVDWHDLRDRGLLEQAIAENLIDLDKYFAQSKEETEALTKDFDALAMAVQKNGPHPETGESGGCWLWLLDNMHPMTRALVAAGTVTVNREGKYLVPLTGGGGRHNLRQREQMTLDLATRLRTCKSLRATYFSVVGSYDPDGIPSYNGDEMDDRLFYNWN
jgi:hypothetical protein